MGKRAKRSAGQTQISISLESDLVAKIDARAKAEHRTRSNLIVHVLCEYLERHQFPSHRDHVSFIEDTPK